ncbi:helix-turn-helix domain-containing protein [Streptomyces sp. NPDC051211]|uniref:PucR family transcriptional regulator n=1 Tax=Streptomyces sp. NPDC051211 TaxID=3154643 RepID=UPI00344C7E93
MAADFPDAEGPATLDGLLTGAGALALRVLAAPGGLGVPVRSTVIHDAGDRLAESPGGVLLLVGTDPADPRQSGVLREAAACGFTAVVVKRRGRDVQRFLLEACAHDVAVLAAADDLPWRNIDAVLSCSLAGPGTGTPLGVGSASGGELFVLADHLAAAVGGAVAIEDLAQNVIAYSGVPGVRIDVPRERGILQRRAPDLPEQRRQYRQVLVAQGVVRFPVIGEELPRAAVAIRAGTLPLGTLWAIEPEAGISAEGLSALAETARLAAPHLLRLLNLPEAERRMRRETLRAVLTNSGPSAEEAAALLGLRAGAELCLVAFGPPTAAGSRDGAAASATAAATLLEHIESELVRHCAAHRPDATVTATGGAVFVLLPQASTAAARRFADMALGAVRRAVAPAVRAAITRSHSDLGLPAALRREAEAVLRATAGAPVGAPAAAASDVRHRILLDRLGDELDRDPWLRPTEVDALLAHDAAHGTGYAATVTAWLDELGDVAAAAGRLQVHPNTLRHRLKRVRELFRLDLGDADIRLAAWLALRRAAESPAVPARHGRPLGPDAVSP